MTKNVSAAKVSVALEKAAKAERDPHTDPRAQALAARFHELRRTAVQSLVELSVSLGDILHQARAVLRGRYQVWVREELGILPRTAANYANAAKLAHEAPALIERHKGLGVSKIYMLARMTPVARNEILRAPGLAGMNDRDFASLARKGLAPKRRVTGNMKGHGLTIAVKAFTARLHRGMPRIEDPARRAELHAALKDLSKTALELASRKT